MLIPREFVKKMLQAECNYQNALSVEDKTKQVTDQDEIYLKVFGNGSDALFAKLAFYWSDDINDWAKENYGLEIETKHKTINDPFHIYVVDHNEMSPEEFNTSGGNN